MKGLRRNKRKFWYCKFVEKVAVTDTDGYETGEYANTYSSATEMYGSISAARGTSDVELFGNFSDYDKTIIIANPNCEIDENTVLFVDKEPNEPVTVGNATTWTPEYDYIVKRVARSLNQTAYAISRVTKS